MESDILPVADKGISVKRELAPAQVKKLFNEHINPVGGHHKAPHSILNIRNQIVDHIQRRFNPREEQRPNGRNYFIFDPPVAHIIGKKWHAQHFHWPYVAIKYANVCPLLIFNV